MPDLSFVMFYSNNEPCENIVFTKHIFYQSYILVVEVLPVLLAMLQGSLL